MNKKDNNTLNNNIDNRENEKFDSFVQEKNISEKEKKLIKKNNNDNLEKEKNILKLQNELEEFKKNAKENQLRAQAEIENMRRRTQIDIEKAYKFSLETFLHQLLPVIDNLERAVKAIQEKNFSTENNSLYQGVELTLKSLLDVVNKFGVISIQDVNIPFNPDIHQAISATESTDVKNNYIIEIIQKGYILNGRLLRPAMVVIAK